MLSEIAITPAVLGPCDDIHPDAHDACLRQLKDFILDAAVVRDLCDSAWSSLLTTDGGQRHQRAKELLKKLKGRLRTIPRCSFDIPKNDTGWCQEALRSAIKVPDLTGIVTVKSTLDAIRELGAEDAALLGTVNALSSSPWWSRTKTSVRLNRRTKEYLKILGVALQSSTHVAFIDANIDPKKPGYEEFIDLLLAAKNANIIEIHRSQFDGSGRDKRKLSADSWRACFNGWHDVLHRNRCPVRVSLWPEMHDRYLITNLVGVVVPYGFDITRDINKTRTTWCRLTHEDRDDVEREFAPEKAAERFTIGQ
jgi:hypothetical protein